MPPLVLAVLAWVIGLLVARAWFVPYSVQPGVAVLLCLLPLAAIALCRKNKALRLGAICALALLLGALRYQNAQPGPYGPGHVAYYNDTGWVTAEGIVSGYPDRRETTTLLPVALSTLQLDGRAQDVHGTVLAQVSRYPEYRYGDRVRISGLLSTPPELDGFSYRQYLSNRGIDSLMERAKISLLARGEGRGLLTLLYRVKDRLSLSIARLLRAPESSLLQGIVLGIRSEIPDGLYEEFNLTSTSHLLVISGANVVVVTALLARSFGRVLGRLWGYWVTMAGLVLYVLLVGADMPVVRAGVMAGLYLTARQLGRGASSYVSLCAAAFFLTAHSPWALWDASFRLSFAATAGLVFLARPLEHLMDSHLWGRVRRPRLRSCLHELGAMATVTLAPHIMVLPLLATSFGRLSLVAPLANLLVAPAQPLIMTWGLLATLLGASAWLLPAARLLAWIPWLLLAYTRAIVHWMAGWPSASVPVTAGTSLWLGLGVYGGLVLLAVARRVAGWRPKLRALAGTRPTRIGLGNAVLALLLLSLTIRELPDRRLHVFILDVGQGDAILITTPRVQVLVDGGPSPGPLLSALGKALPFWDHSIDAIVSTHADGDHITGLVSVLERYGVGGWIDNGRDEDSLLVGECLRRLKEQGGRRHIAAAGDRFDLGDGIYLQVISPSRRDASAAPTGSNDDSLVLRLSHGANSFLLTGDIEAGAELALIQSAYLLQADVLKVAHHGSAGSSTEEFLKAVDPAFAVISVGADNRSGHPAPETLERLAAHRDLLVLRTDLQGTVEFVSDGQQIWVETQR